MDMLRRESRALDALLTGSEDKHGRILSVEKQMTGHLYKRAISGKRRWRRRFFVLKDGFLMYYPAQTTPFVYFDFHPKGLLPLDSCSVAKCEEGPKPHMAFGLEITHPSFGGKSLILASENEADQNKWFQAIENCRFITYKNALLGAQQIESLRTAAGSAHERIGELSAEARALKMSLTSEQHKSQSLESIVTKIMAENRALREALATAESDHNIRIEIPDFETSSTDQMDNYVNTPDVNLQDNEFSHQRDSTQVFDLEDDSDASDTEGQISPMYRTNQPSNTFDGNDQLDPNTPNEELNTYTEKLNPFTTLQTQQKSSLVKNESSHTTETVTAIDNDQSSVQFNQNSNQQETQSSIPIGDTLNDQSTTFMDDTSHVATINQEDNMDLNNETNPNNTPNEVEKSTTSFDQSNLKNPFDQNTLKDTKDTECSNQHESTGQTNKPTAPSAQTKNPTVTTAQTPAPPTTLKPPKPPMAASTQQETLQSTFRDWSDNRPNSVTRQNNPFTMAMAAQGTTVSRAERIAKLSGAKA